MKNAKQAIALASAAALSLSMLAGCGSSASSAASSEAASTATAEATTSTSDGTLVLAETGFEGKFSPFFAASAADQDVIDLTQLGLLGADRKGEMILEEQTTQLNSKQDELAVNIAQANEDLDEASAQQEAAEAAAAEARKKLDEATAALDSYLEAQNKKYGNASITCSLDFGRPLATFKYISCYFGGGGHRGTDYAAPGGTEIYTIADGVVTAATYHYSWGYYVQVYHGTDSNGNTYSTLYAHMNSAPVVSVGQPVSKGQLLGYVGTTGNSTGNHLHLEMKVNGVLTSVTNYIS